jgi:hypothetical protein
MEKFNSILEIKCKVSKTHCTYQYNTSISMNMYSTETSDHYTAIYFKCQNMMQCNVLICLLVRGQEIQYSISKREEGTIHGLSKKVSDYIFSCGK